MYADDNTDNQHGRMRLARSSHDPEGASMTQLADLERRTFLAYMNDGFLDLLLGLMAITLATGLLLDRSTIGLGFLVEDLHIFNVLMWILTMGSWFVGKAMVTRPRLGTVKWALPRRQRMVFSSAITGGAVIFTVAVFLATLWGRVTPDIGPLPVSSLVVGLLFIAVLGAKGFFLDMPRLGAYGLLFAIMEIGGTLWGNLTGFGHSHGVLALAAGAVMLTVAAIHIQRFLKTYPLPEVV
jgi:hypothetical protein